MPIDITDQPRRVQYAISGAGPYDFDFEVLAQTDIAVYRDATLLALTTNYTVALNSDGTGAVTLLSATGTTLTILGARPYRRITDYATGGDFTAVSLNDELDSLQIQILQIDERVDRAIKVSPYDESDVSAELPTSRANKFLAFDADGNAFASAGTGADAGLRTDLAVGTGSSGAALVNYLPNVTGGVARTLRSKLDDFRDGADLGIVANGTDMTLALEKALASGENILLPRGVIGYDGAAGLAFTLAGQRLAGRGTTDVATGPTRGTVLKRLSGTGVGISVPLYLEGIEISNMCFDQNSLGGSALLFKGHKGRLKNLVFHNQAGTAFALRMSGVNLAQVENIIGTGTNYGLMHLESDAVALYGALYSSFKGVRSLNPTTSDAIRINASRGLDLFSTFVESPVYLTNANLDIRFFGLRGELGARSLLKVDALTSGSSEILVKGGKSNLFEDGTAPVFLFDIANTPGVTIEDFSITDGFSAAGRSHINVENSEGFAARNIFVRNSTGNAHWALTNSGTRTDGQMLENIRVLSGDVRIDAKMSGSIRDTDVPITFQATSQLITVENATHNINSANTSGLILSGCSGTITDAGRIATRYGYGGIIARLPTVASAAELNLDGIDASDSMVNVTGTTSITSIKATSSIPGREVTLHFEGVLNFTHGGNIDIGATVATTAGTTIRIACNPSGVWQGVASRAN